MREKRKYQMLIDYTVGGGQSEGKKKYQRLIGYPLRDGKSEGKKVQYRTERTDKRTV